MLLPKKCILWSFDFKKKQEWTTMCHSTSHTRATYDGWEANRWCQYSALIEFYGPTNCVSHCIVLQRKLMSQRRPSKSFATFERSVLPPKRTHTLPPKRTHTLKLLLRKVCVKMSEHEPLKSGLRRLFWKALMPNKVRKLRFMGTRIAFCIVLFSQRRLMSQRRPSTSFATLERSALPRKGCLPWSFGMVNRNAAW